VGRVPTFHLIRLQATKMASCQRSISWYHRQSISRPRHHRARHNCSPAIPNMPAGVKFWDPRICQRYPKCPSHRGNRPQPAENLQGSTSARQASIGNSYMQSFSPRHMPPQQFLQQISPTAQLHHTPGSTALQNSPSAYWKAEAAGDKEDSNQLTFNSGHLPGDSPSTVVLMVVDGLFFDGPTPKCLSVPITIISSPNQNV